MNLLDRISLEPHQKPERFLRLKPDTERDPHRLAGSEDSISDIGRERGTNAAGAAVGIDQHISSGQLSHLTAVALVFVNVAVINIRFTRVSVVTSV